MVVPAGSGMSSGIADGFGILGELLPAQGDRRELTLALDSKSVNVHHVEGVAYASTCESTHAPLTTFQRICSIEEPHRSEKQRLVPRPLRQLSTLSQSWPGFAILRSAE
jgi:hypothetical protein